MSVSLKSMPLRRATTMTINTSLSDDEAIPDVDPNNTSGLLLERLRAWKHACGYLENYVAATEKIQKSHAKDMEKVLKTVSDPLREGHHFDQSLGGVAGLLENIRTNTQGIANQHLETEKNLKGQVLPILNRLHTEIKNKYKEVDGSAGKSAKAVERARGETQKYIELLGIHCATVSASSFAHVTTGNDPYVINRGIYYRLNKQIVEENNNRQDLINAQNAFPEFESHIIATFQQAFQSFNQFMAMQADHNRAIYGDIVSTALKMPPDFEWNGFLQRQGHALVDPNSAPRVLDNATFPNQDHASTKALVEGTLERKSRAAIKGFSTGYYVVTAAKYLHEFKDNDNIARDPTPELSLYLPECIIGGVSGVKFNVKGKDTSGGKVGNKLSMTHEFTFKAHTEADAKQWWCIIKEASGATSSANPTSPSGLADSGQTAGVVGGTLSRKGTTSSAYHGAPIGTAVKKS